MTSCHAVKLYMTTIDFVVNLRATKKALARLWLQESVSSEVRNLLPVSALSWLPHSLLRYLKKKIAL